MARLQLVTLSLFAIAAILAVSGVQDASAAGAISGEFKLGEVLDESVGWFIVVGLGALL